MKVQEVIDETYSRYTEDKSLSEANIFHLHDTGRTCMNPNGSYDGFKDSRYFECFAFNSETNKMRHLGTHDGIQFSIEAHVLITRIFADGSTLIRLHQVRPFTNTQEIYIL